MPLRIHPSSTPWSGALTTREAGARVAAFQAHSLYRIRGMKPIGRKMCRKGTAMITNGTLASARSAPPAPARKGSARIDWIDYAKGICIIMVVMMHSVLGVELAAGQTGFMHFLVAFAKPFRMPDFFLISGLFLS